MDNKETTTMKRYTSRIAVGTMIAGQAAADLKVGDFLMWNYGYITEIVAITPKGKTQMIVTERDLGMGGKKPSGKDYSRTLKRSTTVVRVEPTERGHFRNANISL
jgi:hypothetical protein